jgi:hypothetical protein
MEGNNETSTSTNASIVDTIIRDHKPFQNLRQVLTTNLATLTDEFIKEPVVKATLHILASRRQVELYSKTIEKLEAENSPLPRSLRVKIELTCSEKVNNDANEFQALQSEASIITEDWQLKMKGLFIRAKKLDKERAIQETKNIFFEHCAKILEYKACYAFNLMNDNSEMKKKLTSNGGAKTITAIAIINFFEISQPPTVGQHNQLYSKQKDNLLKLNEESFLLTRDELKSGLLSLMNYDEAKKVINENIINDTDNEIEKAIKSIFIIFIYCLTTLTISTFTKYDDIIHKEKALALTTASLNVKEQEQVTEEVANAIANEASMDTKQMSDYIRKEIQKGLKNELSGRKDKRKNPPVNTRNQNQSPTSKNN